MIELNPNHRQEALAQLLEQFKRKDLIEAWIASFVEPGIQSLDAAYIQLATERSIDTAVGAQLDVLGRIVGADRGGDTDAEYRIRIKGKVLINKSQSTPENMIEILALLTGQSPELSELYPAGFEVVIPDKIDFDGDVLIRDTSLASPAGVRYILNWTEFDNNFGFLNSPVDALGFGFGRWRNAREKPPGPITANFEARSTYPLEPLGTINDIGASDLTDPLFEGLLAASTGGLVPGSRDGVNYRDVSPLAVIDATGIAFNSTDLWILAYANGDIYRSADGVTWSFSAGTSVPLARVIYGDTASLWAVVGFDTPNSYAAFSSNGIAWTNASLMPTTEPLSDVAFGAGLFVAVGDAGAIVSSPDGDTWTDRSVATAADLQAVVWDGSNFLATGTDGAFWRSADGITWSQLADLPVGTASVRCMASNPAGRVFIGASTGHFFVTDDSGDSYDIYDGPAGFQFVSCAWNSYIDTWNCGGNGAIFWFYDR